MLPNPDYVGFWKSDKETDDTFCPQSFFLMFVKYEKSEGGEYKATPQIRTHTDNREIMGDIQDYIFSSPHSNAYFEGRLTKNGKSITFEITGAMAWRGDRRVIDLKEKLEFNGKKHGKSFIGTWKDSESGGEFVLDEYNSLFNKDNNTSLTPMKLIASEIKKLQIRYDTGNNVKC